MLHKPLDILVTNRDPKGRPTIFDLDALKPPRWSSAMPRVMSVGRLDVNSEGLSSCRRMVPGAGHDEPEDGAGAGPIAFASTGA